MLKIPFKGLVIVAKLAIKKKKAKNPSLFFAKNESIFV
jgi:hypothetical protein